MTSCDDKHAKKNINVDDVPIKIQSVRFDKKLFACDTNDIENAVNQLGNKYPDFASVYFNEVTGFAKTNDQQVFMNSVKHFLSYKDYRNLFDTVFNRFPDVTSIDKQLESVFKHVKYYFPKEKLGSIYYFISGLNQWSAITVDTIVGVGLDMHLGKNFPFYESVQLPYYQIQKCEPEYIPVNVSKVIYENMFPLNPASKSLLELMIDKGKQLYFMEHVMPNEKDELLIGYTPAQLKWCQENEGMIWNYFAKQNLLYSTQWQEILRYVNDGPNSTGMPPESPGNIGSWIGWQLIRTYASKHAEKTLPQILSEKISGQKLLQESGYRPK